MKIAAIALLLLSALLSSGCMLSVGREPLISTRNLVYPWKTPFKVQRIDDEGKPRGPIMTVRRHKERGLKPFYLVPDITGEIFGTIDYEKDGMRPAWFVNMPGDGNYLAMAPDTRVKDASGKEAVGWWYVFVSVQSGYITTFQGVGLLAWHAALNTTDKQYSDPDSNPFANIEDGIGKSLRAALRANARKFTYGPFDMTNEVRSRDELLKIHQTVLSNRQALQAMAGDGMGVSRFRIVQ